MNSKGLKSQFCFFAIKHLKNIILRFHLTRVCAFHRLVHVWKTIYKWAQSAWKLLLQSTSHSIPFSWLHSNGLMERNCWRSQTFPVTGEAEAHRQKALGFQSVLEHKDIAHYAPWLSPLPPHQDCVVGSLAEWGISLPGCHTHTDWCWSWTSKYLHLFCQHAAHRQPFTEFCLNIFKEHSLVVWTWSSSAPLWQGLRGKAKPSSWPVLQ